MSAGFEGRSGSGEEVALKPATPLAGAARRRGRDKTDANGIRHDGTWVRESIFIKLDIEQKIGNGIVAQKVIRFGGSLSRGLLL